METKAELLANAIARYYGPDDSVDKPYIDWYMESAKLTDPRLWEWILLNPDKFDKMRTLYAIVKNIVNE